MKIELTDGVIVLRAPMNAATTVRQVPGARHDAKRNVWTLPLSWGTCIVARAVFGDELEIGPKLAEWAREERSSRIQPALELREAATLPSESIWNAALEELEG